MPKSFVRTLWIMRVSAPSLMIAAIAVGLLAYSRKQLVMASVDAALATANLYLTYVEWFVLQPQWPGRRV